MTASTLKTNSKPLKWTTERVHAPCKPIQHRVQKRSRGGKQGGNTSKMTAVIKSDPREEIERLQNELEFTYDTVATITVHFESLHHAYTSSKPALDKAKNATRLGEMEKELLTAYDDLGLQVNHLERKITKLEKRLEQLRQLESILVQTQSPPPVNYDPIASPCSSTDSSLSDYYCQPTEYESDIFFDDWTLCQIMTTNEQYPNCNMQYPDHYQQLYCDLSNNYPYIQ
ncbi:hypothetical protein INT47_002402 [Mucor saturninus]|uniref:Uncharacterized protein n=1 Tax=Mucor saturninus TaxID=64648 RepID=A0A8H7RH76_9FUNG|nr:hypothetical protein INT47_002402 [Mucor saturninus]